MSVKWVPAGFVSAADPVGVEVILQDNKVEYIICHKNRWLEPDCIPGILKKFWYISREATDPITNIDYENTNHILFQQMVTVLYYESKYIIIDGLENADILNKEYPDLIKRIDSEYQSIDLDQVQFPINDHDFVNPNYFTAVGSTYLTESIDESGITSTNDF